jgi:hypothetical protein
VLDTDSHSFGYHLFRLVVNGPLVPCSTDFKAQVMIKRGQAKPVSEIGTSSISFEILTASVKMAKIEWPSGGTARETH